LGCNWRFWRRYTISTADAAFAHSERGTRACKLRNKRVAERVAEKEDWKQLYREGLREWESSDRVFRKLVSRLTLAATGASPALDAVLDQVRRNAKSGELASLEQDLETLSETIKTLDADRRKADHTTLATAQSSQMPDAADPLESSNNCLLYTSDPADDMQRVYPGGRWCKKNQTTVPWIRTRHTHRR